VQVFKDRLLPETYTQSAQRWKNHKNRLRRRTTRRSGSAFGGDWI